MLHSPERRPSATLRANSGLVIFCEPTDGPLDWHLERIVLALRRHGVQPVVTPLTDVTFDIGGRVPVSIPGCGGRLPRAAMVRAIAAGSFEAISTRLGALDGLEAMGVTVWNGAAAIRTCVDKSATSLALVRAGLPTPRTLVTEDRGRALDFLAREIGSGHKVVLKPLFGSQGRGLRLLSLARELPEPDDVFGVYYLQRFLPPVEGLYEDFRVLVSAGRVVAGMRRRGSSWITNVNRGAVPRPIEITSDLSGLALAATAAVGARFAGVDIMRDGAGALSVIEVNSMPAWRGLQSVTTVDIARTLVSDWLAVIESRGLVDGRG